MAYRDPILEARLQKQVAGTSNTQKPVISQPTRSGGFSDPILEARLQNNLGGNRKPLPPLTSIEPIKQQQKSIFQQASDFTSSVIDKAKTTDYKKLFFDIKTGGITLINQAKEVIAEAAQKQAEKEKQYRLDQNIPDYQALTYDQMRDLSSVGLLKMAKGDVEIELNNLKSKKDKTWLDEFRIKNIEGTVKEINSTLEMSPNERVRKEPLITGLALGRISESFFSTMSSLGASALSTVQWLDDRKNKGKDQSIISEWSEKGAKRLSSWASEIAPNNPELSDKVVQGLSSTVPFIITGTGVASLSQALLKFSPKIAAIFGFTIPAFLESGIEAGSTHQEKLEQGFTRDEASQSADNVFLGNIAFNILTNKFGLFNDAKGIKKLIAASAGESLQEMYQQGLQNVNTGKSFDDGMAESGIIAAISGGVLTNLVDNVSQDSSISQKINAEDKKKLEEIANGIRKEEVKEDQLSYEFVNNKKPKANFVDPKVFAESLGGEVGDIKNVNDLEIPEYAKGQISQQQVNIVKEQVRNGDKIDPVVIDRNGNVLDGAHKLTAFKEMGVQDIQTVIRDEAGSQKQEFDYSSTQLDLPAATASKMTEFANSIPETSLYKDLEANYGAQVTGRENEPHITVLYGLNTTNEAEVKKIVEQSEPIEVELGKVSTFDTNEDYDVLKVDVVSKELAALNKRLDDALETPGKTFDQYQPHVTIAYVKKGEGAKYVGDTRFEGQKITLNDLTFSSKDGKKVQIPLSGKTAEKMVNKEVDQAKKSEEYITLYRGMTRKFDNKFDLTKTDAPNGYSTWTDNIELAKQYAGKNGYVYKIELPKSKMGNELIDRDGERVLFVNNEKKAGLNNISGDEYLVYTEHDDYSSDLISPVEIKKEKVEEVKNIFKPKAKSRLKEFPSVLSGLANKGADKIHNFELRKPPVKGTEEFKLHKKIVGLIRKYAQSIGEGYTPRNALGVYFPKTKNIRINNTNNLTVAAHEIAHFLDYANGVTDKLLSTGTPNIVSEIKELYQQYYPTARPNHQERLQALEGFAMLLQKYTEQPTTITAEYPNLVKEFLQPGGKHYVPVVGEILKDLNQIVGEYQELSALDKIGARVTSEGTNIDKKSFLNFWQKLRTNIADEVYPVEVLAKKGKVGFTKEDPSLWVRAYNAVSGIVNNNISTDRGYWTFTDLQNGWQKKYDFNWKSLIESTQRRGITDSFAHYLVSRREYFLYQELDQLEAQKNIVEKIVKAFEKVDPEKMSEFDRDMRASLAEDYGIDLNETEYEAAKRKIQALYDVMNKAYLEQKEILEKDNFKREDVEAAYLDNKERFKDEETMFDALSREDLALLNNPEVQLIDNKTFSQLKSKEGYASFKRQFYDEIVGDTEAQGVARVGGTKVSSLIGRTGSERTIINPLYSAIANHSEIVRKAMKQVVYNQIGKLGSSAIMPNIMQVVPLQTAKQGERIIFPQEKDNNVVMARQNYKRVPVLMDGEIKTVIDTLLTHKNIDVFTQLYTGLSRLFTAGTTGLYPSFALTNFMVDQITATANSYNKFKALYTPMKEMLKVWRQKSGIEAKYFEEYLVMGGERQTFSGWQRLEPKDLFKRVADEKSKMEAAIDMMQKGVDILSIPAAKSEIFSRASEYILARKAGKSQIVSLEEAGRVTAPFHHIGAWGAKEGKRSWGQTFIKGLPFFNASIQVLDQTARVAATPDGKKRMAFVTIAVTAAYLSAIMAMMDASDDQKEQYKDLEAEDLASFIYFPNPTGEGLLRVKMSTTFSIPGTVINMAIANKMFGARYDARDVMEAATAFLPDQLNPTDPTKAILGWIPQVFKPITHVIFNVKEYPTVTSLVSQGLQRKPAALQFNEGTSVFAKKLGELLNISPIKVDYLLTGYLGRASGFLTGKPGIYNPASSIMRDYYFTSGKRVREFYDLKEKNDGEYTAYQNLEKGYENLPKDKVNEIYRKKVITDNVDELLGEYRDIDPKADQEKAAKVRAKIILEIEKLYNGDKPTGLAKYTFEASKRRNKNKLEKK